LNYYYITGTSRGIGRALAERLLEHTDAVVVGLGRSSTVNSSRYQHLYVDLSDLEAVSNLAFPTHPHARRLVLVNNAAALLPKRLGHLESAAIIHEYKVNLVAPTLLMNSFIRAYLAHPAERQIVNITSRAGSALFDGLPVYSASKAGINMLSQVAGLEQKLESTGIRVLAVDPGGVDTDMQAAIRAADPSDFSRAETFAASKRNGQLADPSLVAQRICDVIHSPISETNVLFALFPTHHTDRPDSPR
jgi:benzil reductase ((S)-benzoin forming)